MPQGTHPAGTPPLAQMAPTPGVTPDHEVSVTRPHLNDDIDVVRLARLYPEAFKAGFESAKAAAIAAGEAAFERAPGVIASQQEPVSGQEGQPPPAATPGAPKPAPVTAASQPPPPPPGTAWTPQQIAAWQQSQQQRPPGA